MVNFNHSGRYLTIKGKTTTFEKRAYALTHIDNLLFVILEESPFDPNKAYDNVFAVDMDSGEVKWQVEEFLDPREKNGQYMSMGPFLNAIPGDENYIILTKNNGWSVPVDLESGKIIRDLNLNAGGRPW